MKKSQMTELVLSCPRFTRNLSSRCAGRILCPFQVPTLTVHWSVNGLGDIGWHCPLSRVIHWAKTSTDQAGQSIFLILDWEQVYLAFLFLVNLYRPAFARVSLPHSLIFSNISLYFIRTYTSFTPTKIKSMF